MWRLFFVVLEVGLLGAVSGCDDDNNNELLSSKCLVGTDLPRRYLLYDVNPSEGFNLRRDVYMRIATLARKLREHRDWTLVLPPWGDLYHWKSADAGSQDRLPWSLFFNIPSLKKYAPVMELHEVLEEYGHIDIGVLYYLQHYAEGWENGKWEERMDERPCIDNPPYIEGDDGRISGWFWRYANISANKMVCLSIQGHANTLMKLLLHTPEKFVMIDRSEIVLHDTYGDREYWMARRSMRFSKELEMLALEFRRKHLNSTDETDGTVRPDDWRDEKANRGAARGGPYLCAHMRRRDFVYSRAKHVPSLKGAAEQIRLLLKKLELSIVFVASDAPENEIDQLADHLKGFQVFTYEASRSIRQKYKDGGLAIVDQIICSHARHFVGSFESTFSFRIQEEREIIGFGIESTFNRLCGDKEKNCQQPTQWKVVF